MAEERDAPSVEPAAPEGVEAAPAGFESLLRGDPRRALVARLQRSAGNQAVLGLLRAVAPPADGDQGRGSGVLVEGKVGEFLDLVEKRVHEVAARELAENIYRTAGCPWIDHWIGYYRTRPLDEVEAAVRRYAPLAAAATTLEGYLDAIAERVTDGIRAWQTTGALPEPAATTAAAGPSPEPSGEQAVAREGRPLEPAAATRMGSAFGADFSEVRVHTDAPIGASRAEAAGNEIAFATGQYAPGTPAGDALLAHELAHVLQQTAGPAVARLEDPLLEADADLAAFDAVADLYLPGTTRKAAPQRTTGPAIQSCGSSVEIPEQAPPRPYEQIVAELRNLADRKEGVLAGREPDSSMPEINARIEEVAEELRRLGLRLETGEIMDRLASDPHGYLMQVRGQMIRMPEGPPHFNDKLAFQAVLDYVPPGRLVKYAWRWNAGKSEHLFIDTGKRSSRDNVDIGTGFWSGQTEVTEAKGMEVKAYVYLGDEDTPVTTLTTGWMPLAAPKEDDFALKTTQKVTIVDVPVTIEPAGWAPTIHDYWLDWDDNGRQVASGAYVLNRRFGSEGTHTIVAHLHRRNDNILRGKGVHVRDASIEIVVQDPEKAGEQMLGQMTGEQAPPSTKRLEESIESSIKDIERHVSEGGEQQEFWEDRLKAQRKRLKKLRENIPDIASSEILPGDPSAVEAGHAYSGPVKAVLILPSGGGPQPLSIYVRAWQEDGKWQARLVDMTSADVYSKDGSGSTALAAYEEAFRAWTRNHPYPRGGKVRYEFSPPGWTLDPTFKCRDTAWETVKAWVDGILTVGGVIVGGLLLLVPEPTGATKALGLLFISAAAARSAIAIYENLELGIDALDARNVLEGLSILTSALGVSGSLLRQYGVKIVSPIVYQAGRWTVFASLAGDAGSIVFASKEAIAQLRAVQADPTKDDAQKNGEFLRVAAQLFASGSLFFATNKDLFKRGLKPSDFFKRDPRAVRPGEEPRLSQGSRVDIGYEFKKAGDMHTAERVASGKIPDGELLDRHQSLGWLKTGTPADVEDLTKRLSPATLMAVGDATVAEVRSALNLLGDDKLFEKLVSRFKSGAKVRDIAKGMNTIEQALAGHPDRVASMKRGAQLEAAGGASGFDKWVEQTAKRLQPASGNLTPDHIKQAAELTGELDALHALSAEAAGDPNKVITFTPAPPSQKGVPTPKSFDITITDRAGATQRLAEVHTEQGAITSSKSLHAGIGHAASKLPLVRPTGPVPPKTLPPVMPGATLPTASKEAAVVCTQWPPQSGGGRVYKPDGSWQLVTPGKTVEGHMADDLVRELNGGTMNATGAPYLDRVTVIDGKSGKKVFSLVNQPDPANVGGARHKWVRE